jgi:hypothetical protein
MRPGMFLLLLAALMMPGLMSCKKDRTNQLVDPLRSGAVPINRGFYVVYDDELRTGGGLGLIPEAANQSITLESKNAYSGTNAIQYSWNGAAVLNPSLSPPQLQHDFAGFQLTITPSIDGLVAAIPKNLSSFGYSSMTFMLKGSLSQEVRIRVEGPSDGVTEPDPNCAITSTCIEISTLSEAWQSYTLPLSSSTFSTVRTFFTLTLQYTQPPRTTAAGNGGVVYVDDIRYVQ